MFFAVDSDLRPVRLNRVSWDEGLELKTSGEARELLPANTYQLVWASRFGEPARWFIWPTLTSS